MLHCIKTVLVQYKVVVIFLFWAIVKATTTILEIMLAYRYLYTLFCRYVIIYHVVYFDFLT